MPPRPGLLVCCSIEYIEDITAELRLLLGSGALPPQERLRVMLTAADIAQNQVRARNALRFSTGSAGRDPWLPGTNFRCTAPPCSAA